MTSGSNLSSSGFDFVVTIACLCRLWWGNFTSSALHCHYLTSHSISGYTSGVVWYSLYLFNELFTIDTIYDLSFILSLVAYKKIVLHIVKIDSWKKKNKRHVRNSYTFIQSYRQLWVSLFFNIFLIEKALSPSLDATSGEGLLVMTADKTVFHIGFLSIWILGSIFGHIWEVIIIFTLEYRWIQVRGEKSALHFFNDYLQLCY